MTSAFVWFHNSSQKPADSAVFYEKLLGWKGGDGPPGMTMLVRDGAPVAGVGQAEGGLIGWVPYAEVEDVDAATKRASKLGATVVQAKRRGPAGDFVIIADPGGATVALWQKA